MFRWVINLCTGELSLCIGGLNELSLCTGEIFFVYKWVINLCTGELFLRTGGWLNELSLCTGELSTNKLDYDCKHYILIKTHGDNILINITTLSNDTATKTERTYRRLVRP